MKYPKNLATAFVFGSLLITSSIAHADGKLSDGKLYVEGGLTWSQVGDVDAEFTTENTGASWDIGDMTGGKLQIGSDFGSVRIDAKFQYLEGDVDGISSVTSVKAVTNGEGPNAALGVATLNLYYDIDLNKGAEAKFTPYIGFGVGMARGFMQAEGTLDPAGASPSQVREDHRTQNGTALAGMAGAYFSVNENVGITTEYEYLDVDFGGLSAHSLSLGLRMSF
jgi:opacity protein-like surface antigen